MGPNSSAKIKALKPAAIGNGKDPKAHRAGAPPPPPPAAVAAPAAILSVLGNDDLLREILLLVGLPTSLLCAALVCKRWYRHTSDPSFLRLFGDRHPPRLLGVYLCTLGKQCTRFIPIRPHPELAAAARRACSFFDAFTGSTAFIHDSRDGRLLVTLLDDGCYDRTNLLCSPTSTAGNAIIVEPPPQRPLVLRSYRFLPDCGVDGRSYSSVLVGFSRYQTTVWLYELQDMSWVLRASATAEFPVSPPKFKVTLLDDSRFYVLITGNKILVCDFPSSSISAMELPNGVENKDSRSIMMSRRDGPGIYLIHVKESQLHFFHSDNSGSWFLEQSICLRQVCANLPMAHCQYVDGHIYGVKIRAVGDNAKFVFLQIFGTIVLLDTISKQAEKVYDIRYEDVGVISVHPLMLRWPPVFPELKEGC